jgi:hypothetical protein
VNIDGGEVKTVTLSLKKLEEGRAVVAAPARVEMRSNESHTGAGVPMRAAGYVVGSVGLLGIGVFTVMGLAARNKFDELKSECPARCTDADHLGDVARGKALQTAANVGLVIGALGLGTGATLVILGNAKRGDGTAVSFSGDGGMVRYTGHF